MFEGEALLRRMYRYGFLDESQNKLDYVLALTPQDVLERRLQVRCLRCLHSKLSQPCFAPVVSRQVVSPAVLSANCSKQSVSYSQSAVSAGQQWTASTSWLQLDGVLAAGDVVVQWQMAPINVQALAAQ
jgi:hypothetical protein